MTKCRALFRLGGAFVAVTVICSLLIAAPFEKKKKQNNKSSPAPVIPDMVVAVEGVWLSYWTLAVKPRGQTYVAGEVSVRLQVPIDH